MTNAGWFFMILSWGIILGLGIYCFYRIFKQPANQDSSKLRAPHFSGVVSKEDKV